MRWSLSAASLGGGLVGRSWLLSLGVQVAGVEEDGVRVMI